MIAWYGYNVTRIHPQPEVHKVTVSFFKIIKMFQSPIEAAASPDLSEKQYAMTEWFLTIRIDCHVRLAEVHRVMENDRLTWPWKV